MDEFPQEGLIEFGRHPSYVRVVGQRLDALERFRHQPAPTSGTSCFAYQAVGGPGLGLVDKLCTGLLGRSLTGVQPDLKRTDYRQDLIECRHITIKHLLPHSFVIGLPVWPVGFRWQ